MTIKKNSGLHRSGGKKPNKLNIIACRSCKSGGRFNRNIPLETRGTGPDKSCRIKPQQKSSGAK